MKSQILARPGCLLPLALCILLLTACGSLKQGASELLEQGTPTVATHFAVDALPASLVDRSEGTPTVSPHLAGAQPQAHPSISGTPTLSPYIAGASPLPAPNTLNSAPTAAPYLHQQTTFSTKTPCPTHTPYPTPLPITPTPSSEEDLADSPQLGLAKVYTDTVAVGWSVTESWGVRLDLEDTTHAHDGEHAIAVTPEEDYGSLFFHVKPASPNVYPYTRTMGVRFWLNPGAEPIYLDQLAVMVIGSNAHTHWEEDDDSVEIQEGESFFSETRLYYLELNRALPAETWNKIMVWLEDLPFDPDYTYVTGLYVKSAPDLQQTFYVDEVALVVLES